MTFVFLSIFFVISLGINIFFLWYVYNAIKKMQFMSSAFEELDVDLQAFDQHLNKIYELEMYYGDQTLEGLLKHSKDLLSSFEEVRRDYEIFNGDTNEEQFFQDEQEKEEDNTAKT